MDDELVRFDRNGIVLKVKVTNENNVLYDLILLLQQTQSVDDPQENIKCKIKPRHFSSVNVCC